MKNGEIIICGLTDWERQEIKEHKGECKHCMYYDWFYDGATGEHYRRCDKFKTNLTEYSFWEIHSCRQSNLR